MQRILCKLMGMLLAASCLFSMPAGADQGVVRIATEPSFAPFEFMDEKTGKFAGFDIELIEAIVRKAGMTPKISNLGFDALIPSLKAGNIDVAIAGMTITAERAKNVDFSKPYYDSGLIVAVHKDNNAVKGIDDLKGKRIAVQIGTSGEARGRKVPGATVLAYNTNVEATMEMVNRNVDAVINDAPVVEYYLAQGGSKDAKTVGSLLQAEQYGFAVKKGNTKLLAALNKALDELRANGQYAAIYKKWFGREPAGSSSQKVVRAACEPSFAPFEFMDEKTGKLSGFDIELIGLLCRTAGYRLELSNLGFDALIPSLKAGNIDVAISGMTITAERAKSVDFSKPYYDSGLVVLVRKDNSTVKGIEDLKGKRIAVQIGTSGEARARKVEGATVLAYNTNVEATMEMVNRNVDAVINDSPVVGYYLAQGGSKDAKTVGPLLQAEQYGFAVKKGNKALLDPLNAALDRVKANGEYDKLQAKWFGKSSAQQTKAAAEAQPTGLAFIWSILPLLVVGAGLTLKITALSVGLGFVFGCIAGVARISQSRIARLIAVCYIDFLRGTPLLVQIFIVYFALPHLIGHRIDPFVAAVAACSINSGAYVAEIFRAGIQSIDPGQMEAGRAIGLTWMKTMRLVILPQAFRRIIPPLGNEFIAMLKDSSLVSVIGFEELTRCGQLVIARTYASFEVWIAVAIIYLVMTLTVSRLVAYLEKRLIIK